MTFRRFRMKKGQKKKPVRKFEYSGYKMASRKEVTFAEQMDEDALTWMYECERLDWAPPPRKYTPDFKVMKKDGGYFFVEYKGYLDAQAKIKMTAVRKQYPNLDIRFVFQNALKPVSGARPRKDGSVLTHAEWADNNGYPWTEGYLKKSWVEESKVRSRKERKNGN